MQGGTLMAHVQQVPAHSQVLGLVHPCSPAAVALHLRGSDHLDASLAGYCSWRNDAGRRQRCSRGSAAGPPSPPGDEQQYPHAHGAALLPEQLELGLDALHQLHQVLAALLAPSPHERSSCTRPSSSDSFHGKQLPWPLGDAGAESVHLAPHLLLPQPPSPPPRLPAVGPACGFAHFCL